MKKWMCLFNACIIVACIFIALASFGEGGSSPIVQGISDSSYPTYVSEENTIVETPALITPISDTKVFKGQTVIFEWSSVSGALKYMMSFSQTSDFIKQTKLFGDNKGAMNQSTILSLLKNKTDGKYYWRARASGKPNAQLNKDSDWGPWSTVGMFMLTSTYNIADYYFPISVGNQWNYTDGQYTITGIIQINNETVFVSEDTFCTCGTYNYITWDERGGLWWGNSEEGIFTQPFVMFPLTWKISEKKQITWTEQDKDILKSGTLSLKLERVEDVTTPAGQFKNCLRFSVSVSVRGEHSDHYKEVLHFAKGVGLVRTQRLKGDSPHSGCFLAIDPYGCCPTCNWAQELVSAVINGINIP
jgi:hypothetical protein